MKKITLLTPEQYTQVAILAGISDTVSVENLPYHGEQLLLVQMYSFRCNVLPINWLKVFDYLREQNIEIPSHRPC